MKWNFKLKNILPIAIFVLGISIAIIYCFQQNIKARESEKELDKYKEEQIELGAVPEIKNGEILYWNIKGMKQLQRFQHLRNDIISHYNLEESIYLDNDYVDVFIHDNKFFISDRKYQKEVKHSDKYTMYAIDMNTYGEKHIYGKYNEENLKRTYERLF